MPRPNPPPSPSPSPTTTSSHVGPTAAASDLNTMVVVAAIVCAFLCALGLHSMLQCAVQCANRALVEPLEWVQSRRLNSGLKKKDMVALPTSVYKAASSASPSPSRCAICLTDFSEGDKIRVLPKCNHRFHVACVDKWLLSHSSCPNCRNTVKSCENLTC